MVLNTANQGYFSEFEVWGGGSLQRNVWGGVSMREAQIYIKKH